MEKFYSQLWGIVDFMGWFYVYFTIYELLSPLALKVYYSILRGARSIYCNL